MLRHRRLVVGLVLAAAAVLAFPAPATADTVSAPATVSMPRDEAPHQQPVEWWYFSGHLRGRDASGHEHRYGFEYVTFQFLEPGQPGTYIANFAVTDLTRHTFQYAAQPDSYAVPKTPGRFDVHTGAWRMRGAHGVDTIDAQLAHYRLSLHLLATKPATLHGTHGVIPFGPFGTSAYYSWTSLAAAGTIVDHGVPVSVYGISWMDHQWGAIDFSSGGGWDWFSLQLHHNRQYMLYFIRDAAGKIVQKVGTRTDPQGRVTHLPKGSFRERTLRTWTSPSTGITYGSGWKLTLPGGWLHVTPAVRDQEVNVLDIQGVIYWEGTVHVRGVINGRPVSGLGYTEINPPSQP